MVSVYRYILFICLLVCLFVPSSKSETVASFIYYIHPVVLNCSLALEFDWYIYQDSNEYFLQTKEA